MGHMKEVPSSLCDSCRYVQKIKRKDSNDWVYDCGNGESPYFNWLHRDRGGLPQIEGCSGFLKKGAMSLNEMNRTAWLLNTDPKRPIGFAPPGSDLYKEMEKERGRYDRPIDIAELAVEPD